MTIENRRAFLRSLWNWAPLDGCFPRGIKTMDIDGWTEVGGVFLVLEGKGISSDGSYVPLKPGTVHTFQRMQRWNQTVPNLFTIIVLWGDAEEGRIDRLQFWPNPPFKGGWPQLIDYVNAWAENAEARAGRKFTPALPAVIDQKESSTQRACDQCGRVIYQDEEWFAVGTRVQCGDCHYDGAEDAAQYKIGVSTRGTT